MSVWLSAANRLAGSIRGQASAQATRQIKTAATRAQNDVIQLWTTPATPAAAKRKRSRQG